jgi:hypothetical protein
MEDRYADMNKEVVMPEKTEWEVIDDGAQSDARPNMQPTPQQLLRAMLGPYWRWKIAGFFILAGVVLALLIAFVGAVALTMAAAGFVLFATATIRRWLHRGPNAHLTNRR